MKDLLFICNPHAGKGLVRQSLSDILFLFDKAGYRTTVHFTQGKEDATRVAAELGGRFDRVVCCGGDGTLNEVVSGLLTLPAPPVLGYIPGGSTNDSARNFHLPKDMTEAAATAVFGMPRPCDMGFFNGTPFVYVAAFGAFTQVAYDTSQELKNKFGHLAYVVAGLASLTSIHPYAMTVEHDGGVLSGNFIYGMASNTFSVGGFAPFDPASVQLDDGLHEVMLVRDMKSPADLHALLHTLIQKKPVAKDTVEIFRTSRLTITSRQAVPWTLDGEEGGKPKKVCIENHPRAITVACGT